MKKSNYKYWSEFYKDFTCMEPSPFAKFVYSKIKRKKNIEMIDLGCGNGRDSYFFANNNIRVLAIDLVPVKLHHRNIISFCTDFTKLNDIGFDCHVIYSRFSLHSINLENEKKVLKWVYNNLAKGGLFFVEARTDKDVLFGKGEKLSDNEFIDTHYRRFLNFQDFLIRLYDHQFEVEYAIESDGLAEFKGENPVVLRVVAKKLR